jgi:hypothetical protein
MACGPKELRRARTVLNPILAEEFEKLAQSWLRLATLRNKASRQFDVRLRSERRLSVGHAPMRHSP